MQTLLSLHLLAKNRKSDKQNFVLEGNVETFFIHHKTRFNAAKEREKFS